MKASQGNALLNEIWSDYITQEEASHASRSGGAKKKGKSGSFMTVSMLYRESLNNLMSMLYSTHPHFIRCIIPNEKKKSGLLDAALVLNQLTCNGVLEGIRICRKGFPNRTAHPDFVQRYSILGADESKSSQDPKECAMNMLKRLCMEGSMNEDMFKVGLSKVFFKAGVLAHLEDLRDAKLTQLISGFQAQIRYFFALYNVSNSIVTLFKKRERKFLCFIRDTPKGRTKLASIFEFQIDLKEREKRFAAALIIQRNVGQWAGVIGWSWFRLYVDTIPIIQEAKRGEILDTLRSNIGEFEQKLAGRQQKRDALEQQLKAICDENERIAEEVRNSASGNVEVEHEMQKMLEQQSVIETQINESEAKLNDEKRKTDAECEAVSKLAKELQSMQSALQNTELTKRKMSAEQMSLTNQIRSLSNEIALQKQNLTKLSKQSNQQQQLNQQIAQQLETAKKHNADLENVQSRLTSAISAAEGSLHAQKTATADTERAKRKLEGELKVEDENLKEVSKEKEDLVGALRRKETALRDARRDVDDRRALQRKL
ncbi:unnamed protein product, partial [Anisakis simplex]